jgi:hypothetical protein
MDHRGALRHLRTLLVGFLLILAACGDDAETVTTVAPTTTTATTTTTTTTTVAPTTTTAAPLPPGTYSNAEHGFRVAYPKGWSVEEDAFGSIVLFASPLLDDDDFAENVGITAEDLRGQIIALDDYAAASLEVVELIIPDFELLDEGPAEVGGAAAWTLFYSGTFAARDVLWVQTLTIHRGLGFVLTYTGSRDFDHFLDDAMSIFESFEFLG